MKKIVYISFLSALVILLTSAISSFNNKTLVLPPDSFELDLPEDLYEYSVEFPLHIENFNNSWGTMDTASVGSITSEGATLGRVLFYDDRLSGDNSLSCASCHKQELSFADDVPLSDGIGDNLTTRNSMQLNDIGWQLGNSFFWDLRSQSLQDAVIQPILAAHELGKDIPTLIAKLEAAEEYGPLFENAFGSSEINQNRIAAALSQFIASMTTFESKFDQQMELGFTEFTVSEMNGLNLFDQNCGFCHVTPHFGSADFFIFGLPGNNGLDSVFTDLGMGGWMGDEFLNGFFKSPSLRNIEVTAPFMHDGRFETLEDVVDFYSEGVQFNEGSSFNWMFGNDFTGFDFTDEEKADLVIFLKTLTDQTLLTHDKWSNPWKSTTSISPVELKGVNVFPNPVADVVMVEINNQLGETFDISIFDVNGKLINSYQTTNNLLEVPRGNAPSGIYELVASNGKNQKTFKLVYR